MNLPALDQGPGVMLLHHKHGDVISINLNEPKPEHYRIRTVAHALSQVARFNGHTPLLLSVAAHALAVSKRVAIMGGSAWEQLVALHHDDTQGLGLGDIPTPLKRLLPEYKFIEARVWDDCVSPALELGVCFDDIPERVHQADFEQLEHEWAWRYGHIQSPLFRGQYLFGEQAARQWLLHHDSLIATLNHGRAHA